MHKVWHVEGMGACTDSKNQLLNCAYDNVKHIVPVILPFKKIYKTSVKVKKDFICIYIEIALVRKSIPFKNNLLFLSFTVSV